MATRTRLATWNFATGLLFTALTLATSLVASPLLVGWLGKERFGVARMTVEVFGYLALLELGLGAGLGPILARALGRGDHRALRGALAAGLRVYLAMTAVTLAAGLALAASITRLVPVPADLVGDLRRAAAITLLGFATLALSPFRALAEAHQRGYRVNLLLSAQALVVTATALALAWSGWGITGQAAASVLGTALVALALALQGLRAHPGLLAAALAAPPEPEALRSLRGLSLRAMLLHLSGRLSFMTDSYIVGRLLGPDRIASLFATQRLAQVVQAQLQGIGNATWAGLAELHARGQRDAFNHRLVELSGLIGLLGVAALAPIVAYDRPFVALWMRRGDVPYGGDLLVVAAAAVAALQALFSLWTWCFSGTGQVARVLPAMVASSALNLAASVYLTGRLGLAGPLLGTLVAFLAVNAWFLPLELRRAFGTPLRPLALAVARPIALGLPYAAGLWWLARAQGPLGWTALALQMGGAALGYLALAAVTLFGPSDRARWRARLADVWPRRPVAAEAMSNEQ